MLAVPFASAAASVGDATAGSAIPVSVIEFYDSTLDHYFITADPIEVVALDSGEVPGWSRTGFQFAAYASDSTADGLSPVCRFYGLPAYGLDSHFFSALPKECADASTNFERKWVLESDDVFRVILPDPTTGTCVAGSVPVYRIFNNRPDANHRYTTDVSVRQQMIAKGGVP